MLQHSKRSSRPRKSDPTRSAAAKRATLERKASRAEKWLVARAELKAMGGE